MKELLMMSVFVNGESEKWPDLTEDLWREMTIDSLKGHLRGNDVNAANGRGRTPLMVASRNRSRLEILQILLANSADVNAKDDHGWNPLMYADRRRRRNPEIARLLRDNGATE